MVGLAIKIEIRYLSLHIPSSMCECISRNVEKMYSFDPLSCLAYVTRSCVILSRQTDRQTDNTRLLARFMITRLNTYMYGYKPQLKVGNDVPFSLVIPAEIELCPHEIRAVGRAVKNTTRVPVCRYKPWIMLITLEFLISTAFGIS